MSAQDVYANDDAKQAEVNAATKTLTDAIAALEKPKPTEPVAQPQNVVHLSSQSDLENKFKPADADAYYVLDNDITIDDEYFFAPMGILAGTLDGQGHTITFANGGGVKSLMGGVASTGVVQNISLPATEASDGRQGVRPPGQQCAGRRAQLLHERDRQGRCGLCAHVRRRHRVQLRVDLRGTAGALFATYNAGQLVNTYWGAFLTNKMDAPASRSSTPMPSTRPTWPPTPSPTSSTLTAAPTAAAGVSIKMARRSLARATATRRPRIPRPTTPTP